MTEEKVGEAISKILRDRFGLSDLVDVNVRPDVDFDGGAILLAKATFPHRPAKPPAASVEVIGAIRDAMLEQGESRSVVLSDNYLDEPELEEEDVE